MSIINISTQPAANSFVAAYRPILLTATESNLSGYPSVTYCDVYIAGVFFKTLQNTNMTDYHTTFGSYVSNWTFDIQGVVQEALGTFMPDITLATVQNTGASQGMVAVTCLFRTSTRNAYGVVTPQGPVPVQATVDTAAVSGGGYVGNNFFVLNASLQHLEDQALLSNLRQYAVTNAGSMVVDASTIGLYPLSHMPRARVYLSDYGKYPLLTATLPFNGLDYATPVRCSLVFYDGMGLLKLKYLFPVNPSGLTQQKIYLLPTGPAELIAAIGANNWDVTGFNARLYAAFQQCIARKGLYYRVAIEAGVPGIAGWTPVFVTPQYFVVDNGAWRSAFIGTAGGLGTWMYYPNGKTPHTRIWFRNYIGQFDQVNFRMREEVLRVSSSPREKPLTAIPIGTGKSTAGKERMNVRSNETNVLTEYFREDEIPWLKELMGSSKTYVETHLPYNSPTGVLVPIRITDSDFETLLWEDESYTYKVTLKYEMSNENIIVRN